MPSTSIVARILRVAGGLVLLGVTFWIVGPAQLVHALRRVDAPVFVCALLLAIASNLISALRWAAIGRALDLHAPGRRLMPMYARAMTSNTLLPGATLSGDMLRSYELSRLGNPLLESSVSVAFDRLSGLWTLCVMSFAAAALAWTMGFTPTAGVHGREVLAAYGLVLAAIVSLPFMPWPIDTIRRLPGRTGRRLADLWARIRDQTSGLRLRLMRTLWLSFVVQVFSAGALALCGMSLGSGAPAILTFAAAAPIFVMAALPVGVAGFGTRELAAVAVLGLAGVDPETAAGTGLLYGVLGVIQGTLAAPLFLLRR